MKSIAICGSSGFIGQHLVKRLMGDGCYVVGIDIRPAKFWKPDEFYFADLRDQVQTNDIFIKHQFDEVYNMGCLMGGMGFIGNPENSYDVMIGSSLISINVLNACVRNDVNKILYPSSACVYPEFKQSDIDGAALKEKDAYPSMPDMPYGWQKLFSEQIHEAAKLRGINIRMPRFHNVYGDRTIYEGGKEKAPAAICRKVAMAKDGDEIEIWGDGKQVRSFMYVEDCLDGMQRLMASDYDQPLNIGSDEAVSINELARIAIAVSGKNLTIRNIVGNQGVRFRNSDNALCRSILNWEPITSLPDGIRKTYEWINQTINHGNI